MKFEEVLPALRADKKVRRSSWGDGFYIVLQRESPRGGELVWWDGSQNYNYYSPSRDDFNANDWEIVKETRKVKLRDLTEEQYREYEKDCEKRICAECPFHDVECDSKYDNCWFKHKDLYSDKFLDREVEIERK